MSRRLPSFASVGALQNQHSEKPLEIDLLSGGEEWEKRYGRPIRPSAVRDLSDVNVRADIEDDDTVNPAYVYARTVPRGPIDTLVDASLQKLRPFNVRVSRQGKKDGVYWFGQRRMLCVKAGPLAVQVQMNPRTMIEIEEFFKRFLSVEEKRAFALQGASGALLLLQGASSSQDVLP